SQSSSANSEANALNSSSALRKSVRATRKQNGWCTSTSVIWPSSIFGSTYGSLEGSELSGDRKKCHGLERLTRNKKPRREWGGAPGSPFFILLSWAAFGLFRPD